MQLPSEYKTEFFSLFDSRTHSNNFDLYFYVDIEFHDE